MAAGVPTSPCDNGSLGRECRTVQMSLYGHNPICGQQCHSKTHFGAKVENLVISKILLVSGRFYLLSPYTFGLGRRAIKTSFCFKKCICCYRLTGNLEFYFRLIPVIVWDFLLLRSAPLQYSGTVLGFDNLLVM